MKGVGSSYDLGLRFYDSRLGRMFSIDSRADEYPWQSTYVYHANSPVAIIDYLGGGGEPENGEGDPPASDIRKTKKIDADGLSSYELNEVLIKGTAIKPEKPLLSYEFDLYGNKKLLIRSSDPNFDISEKLYQDRDLFRYLIRHAESPDEQLRIMGMTRDAYNRRATPVLLFAVCGPLAIIGGGELLIASPAIVSAGKPIVARASYVATNTYIRTTTYAQGLTYSVSSRLGLIGAEATTANSALVTKYPANPSVTGTSQRTFLMPGQMIDRFGSLGGRWFSPVGTSYGARSLPPGLTPLTRFQVLKPFEVQQALASPGLLNGQTGFGIQFQSPVGADILIKRGIITPF